MSTRWRLSIVVGLTLWLGWLAAANFVSSSRRSETPWLPDQVMRLGLDLRGGIHMVISPDLEVAMQHELSLIQSNVLSALKDRKIEGTEAVVTKNDEVHIKPANSEDLEAVRSILADNKSVKVENGESPGTLVAKLTPEAARTVRDRAVAQSLEVLRRRVDDPQTGIPESVVTKQGQDRILVQIPGVSRVPDIFRQTGFLEFKIVKDEAPNQKLLEAKYPQGLPPGDEIIFHKDRETGRVLKAYLVPKQPDITGDYLQDAQVNFDNQRNEWIVNFTWNSEGGRIFGKLTEDNIGKPLAIILDNDVYSTPTIQSRISREGMINGSFTSKEAGDLAVILRSGALPIPVHIVEERTIGPALGRDSIRSGLIASIAGFLIVVGFMSFYYRLSGIYASIALLDNFVMLVGLMSLFHGTLTMPGIAGLVLTLGMAVDGNVIIFERIREELRAGRAPRAAISTGFDKALWTILDANITTLITGLVLFQYGTGPIKGFAVTLSIGIVTSVFTALFVTKLLYDWRPGTRHVSSLSI
jgi:preprotein translocase subunit SecD